MTDFYEWPMLYLHVPAFRKEIAIPKDTTDHIRKLLLQWNFDEIEKQMELVEERFKQNQVMNVGSKALGVPNSRANETLRTMIEELVNIRAIVRTVEYHRQGVSRQLQ